MITEERKKELDALRTKVGGATASSSGATGIKAKILARQEANKPKLSFMEDAKEDAIGFASSIMPTLKRRAGNFKESDRANAAGEQTPMETGMQYASDIIGTPLEILGNAVIGAGKAVLPQSAEDAIAGGVKKIGETEIVQKGMEKFDSFSPRTKRNLKAGTELVSVIPGVKVAKTSVGLAAKLSKRVAPTVLKTGAKVVTAPLKVGGEAIAGGTKFAASKATGLEPSEMSTIFRNPEKFSKSAREGVDREAFAKEVGDQVVGRKKDLTSTGKGYNDIRDSGEVVKVDKGEIAKTLDQKFKIKYDGKKVSIDKESTPLTESERGQLESFLAKYSDTDEMSSNAFLNARKALDGMSKWYEAGSSGGLKNIARSLRYTYNKAGRTQLKGLKDLDAKYGPERKELSILEKDLFHTKGDRRGELKPTAVSKLANLTGKGKEDLLKRLEKMRPGITEEVNILRAVEGIERATGNKVGAYAQSALGTGGVMAGLATGNPLWALLAISSYPRVAVNIIRSAGMVARYGSRVIDAVNGKIKAGKALTPTEVVVVKEALKQSKPSRKVRKIIQEKAPEAYERVFKSSRTVKLDKDVESVVSPIQKKNVKVKVKAGGEVAKVARETSKKEVAEPKKSVLSSIEKPLSTKANSIVKPLSTKKKTIVKSKIEKLPLRGKDAKIQKKSIEMYDKNPTKLLKAYKALPGVNGGKLINADEARKLFKKIGYVGSNSQAVQEASSQIAKDVWRDMLATTKRKEVFLTAGGSGSGKTSAIKKLMGKDTKNSVVLDGNLSKVRSAMQRLEEAIDAGKKPVVVYTYREPLDAWENGVIKRMISNPDEGGRVVPLSVFLQNHQGSYNVVKKLRKLGVDVRLIDNSRGAGKQRIMSTDKFEKVRYDKIESKLRSIVEEKYARNEITKTQKNKLLE